MLLFDQQQQQQQLHRCAESDGDYDDGHHQHHQELRSNCFLHRLRPSSPSKETLFELIASLKEEILTQSQQVEELQNRNENMAEKVSIPVGL